MSKLRFDFSNSWFGPSQDADDPWNHQWYSVANILTDYIQTNSELPLEDAVHQVVELWKNSDLEFEGIVLGAPISIADQIPYDHPAHQKLAGFMLALHDSGGWVDSDKDVCKPFL